MKMNFSPITKKNCPMLTAIGDDGTYGCCSGEKSFRIKFAGFDYYICDNHLKYTKKYDHELIPLTNGEKLSSV